MAKTYSNSIVPSNENETVRIRKIENGYVITHECYSKKNGYTSKECFSPQKPVISAKSNSTPTRAVKSNSLMRAVKELK